MGRHDGRAAEPAARGYVRLGRAVARWSGRLLLGAFAGGVVLAATLWAGTSWEAARALGGAAAVLVVVASALAGTLPAVPEPAPPAVQDGPGTRRTEPRDDR
ncbi:hypothetical protein [Cellulomonas phragmiteti]|uniref:Phage holin family protein n=1 Tax=Cellulomonas phragmiteti TaxID=478780 RepID=A0ABQ4DG54_9CELL|nr:hypothetical protein [Cellulomonas phragmiteti]GIG38315.1 hypothetical protein Cph01nite_00770 [Cellulomonas phragmiteti]